MSLRVLSVLALALAIPAQARPPAPLGKGVVWHIKLPPGAVAANHLPQNGQVIGLADSAPLILLSYHDQENWEIRDWQRNKPVARFKSKQLDYKPLEDRKQIATHVHGLSADGRLVLHENSFGHLVGYDWAKRRWESLATLPGDAAKEEYWEALVGTSPLAFCVKKADRIEYRDAKTGKRLHLPVKLPEKRSVFSISLSPCRRFAEIGIGPDPDAKPKDTTDDPEEYRLRYYDLLTGKELGRLEELPPSNVHPTRWTPDSRFLCSSRTETLEDEEIDGFVHEFASGRCLLPAAAKPMGAALSGDGRLCAVIASSRMIDVWDMAHLKRVHRFTAPRGKFERIQFLMGGKFLASVGQHPGGSVVFDEAKHGIDLIVWDIASVRSKLLPLPALGDPSKAWTALAAKDSKIARRAVWSLAGDPRAALPMLAKRLKPAPRPGKDDKPLAQNPERLRAWRAIEVLERIGGDEAMRLLRRLESGKDAGDSWRPGRLRSVSTRLGGAKCGERQPSITAAECGGATSNTSRRR